MLTENRADYTKRIRDIVERAVRERLGATVDRVDIRFEEDQGGEQAIFVDAVLRDDAPASLGRQFVEAQLAVMAALERAGDERFPYLVTKRPNDEYPEDVFVRPPRKRRA